MTNNTRITAGRAIVDALRAEGVRHVFGIPGGHVIEIYNALFDADDIRHILVRHEAHAASMAAAYAQLTGEPGVCLVTAGPGATNLITGIAEAYVGSLPIVILAGRGITVNAHRGASQEIPTDQMFAPITKWSARIDRPDLVSAAVNHAFTVARNGKPGPVLLDLPRDVLDAVLDPGVASRRYIPSRRATPVPEAASVEDAVDRLLRAQAPVIVAGGGVIAAGAAAELRKLAEVTATPVLTSLSGRGSIPDDHPLSVGGLGAHRNPFTKALLAEADVVLNFGCRFEEMETNWRPGFVPSPSAHHIQVDIDPTEIGRSIPAHSSVIGDIRRALEQMLVAVGSRGASRPAGAFATQPRIAAAAEQIAAIEAEIERLAASAEKPIHPLRVIRAIRDVFPRDATIAFDIGKITQQIAGGFPYFKTYGQRTVISPSSFYGMGFVAASAPAARLAYPDRHAVCLVGDGSFQMVMNILPTAVENHLPVTWCVFNDAALGSIRDIQEFSYQGRFIATEFTRSPDLDRLAEACGCYGERVEEPADVAAAVERALKANEEGRPAVIDFAVARTRLEQTRDHYGFYQKK